MLDLSMFPLVFVAVYLTICGLLAWFLAKMRPDWSGIRVALLSALPIPSLVWALCAFIFIHAMSASKEQCGVDACGMAIAAAMGLAMSIFVMALVGLATSAVITRLVWHKQRDDGSDAVL